MIENHIHSLGPLCVMMGVCLDDLLPFVQIERKEQSLGSLQSAISKVI